MFECGWVFGTRTALLPGVAYLGYFDDETCRLEPIENPFGPRVLPMSPAVSVKIVVASVRTPH
jgi:hypothetical protein